MFLQWKSAQCPDQLLADRYTLPVAHEGGALLPLPPSKPPRPLPLHQQPCRFAVCEVVTPAARFIKGTLAGAFGEYSGRQAIFSHDVSSAHGTMPPVLASLPLRGTMPGASVQADHFAMPVIGHGTEALDQGLRLNRFSSGLSVGLTSNAGTSVAGSI